METAAAAQRIDRIFTPSLSTSAVAAEGNIDDKDKDIEKDRMDDIHEIPYLLLQDFNPMMVTCTVKKVTLFLEVSLLRLGFNTKIWELYTIV